MLKTFITVCLVAIATATMSAAPVTLSLMRPEEQKACGLEKLSPEEKHALDLWLERIVPTPIAKKNKMVHGDFAITATQELGRYVQLDNGLTVEITSRSRKKTMAWKVGEKVRLTEPSKKVSYKLENLSKKQTVAAKVAEAPIPEPKAEKPEEPKSE